MQCRWHVVAVMLMQSHLETNLMWHERSRKRVANSQIVYRIIDRSILCRKMQPLYGHSSHYDPINTTRSRSACCEAHV